MGDVIDFSEQKRKMLEKTQCEMHGLTPEENAAIIEIQERITEKYLSKLQPIDHTFSFESTPEQAEIIKTNFFNLRDGMTKVVVELMCDLIQSEIFLYFKENPR
ncbi:MAG: hypothetical protein GJV46_16495 [Geobacter sp.]|nr:hypothetical protein [Geobacter sp.]